MNTRLPAGQSGSFRWRDQVAKQSFANSDAGRKLDFDRFAREVEQDEHGFIAKPSGTGKKLGMLGRKNLEIAVDEGRVRPAQLG